MFKANKHGHVDVLFSCETENSFFYMWWLLNISIVKWAKDPCPQKEIKRESTRLTPDQLSSSPDQLSPSGLACSHSGFLCFVLSSVRNQTAALHRRLSFFNRRPNTAKISQYCKCSMYSLQDKCKTCLMSDGVYLNTCAVLLAAVLSSERTWTTSWSETTFRFRNSPPKWQKHRLSKSKTSRGYSEDTHEVTGGLVPVVEKGPNSLQSGSLHSQQLGAVRSSDSALKAGVKIKLCQWGLMGIQFSICVCVRERERDMSRPERREGLRDSCLWDNIKLRVPLPQARK